MTKKVYLFLLVICYFLVGSHAIAQEIIYVAANGSDSNDGSHNKPLASMDAAIANVSKLPVGRDAVILIRGGEYYFEKSIFLTENEKARRKITISNYKNEKVIFTGGRYLKNTDFKKVTEQQILDRLPEEAREKVLVVDLREKGITDYGKIIPHGFNRKVEPSPLEFFIDGQPQTIARWPNSEVVKIGKVIERGSKKTEVKPVFEFDYDRAERWKKADDICISGIFTYGYADDNMPIDSIDYTRRTITLSVPASYPVYASDEDKTDNVAANYATYQRRYFIYNLLEEIDQPGEWFMDNINGKLYLYPPKELSSATIEISMLKQPFIELNNVANVTIRGIDFKCSRGLGIFMQNIQSVSVSNCNFYNLGIVGIQMEEMLTSEAKPALYNNKDITISYCNVYNTGTGGIYAQGGINRTLTPGNVVVENCEIYKFNRLNHTYCAAVNMGGVGNKIRHCYIHDATHLAIGFSGNNHIIEYNHFKDLCKNSSDMGVIYSGRNPAWRGTVIRNNYFQDIVAEYGYSIAAVYIDDGSGGMKVESNIFRNAGKIGAHNFGAVNMNGGHSNYCNNNIFIDCERAFSYNQWGDDNYTKIINSELYQNRMFKDVDIHSEIYLAAYPELKNFMNITKLEQRQNFSFNTIIVGDGELSRGTQFINTDFLISKSNPGFKNLEKNDFRIIKGSEIEKKLPGFKAIDFKKIGIQKK